MGKVAVLAVPLSSFPQDFLQGDCTKARQKLNWKPRVTFDVSGPVVPAGCSRPLKTIPREGEGGATPLCGVTWAP